MPLQFGQIIEGVGAVQLAGMDQAHVQVAHLSSVQRLIKQRVLAIQDGFQIFLLIGNPMYISNYST